MKIDLTLLEKSINSLVDEILKQTNSEVTSSTTLQEAISKIGVISALVMNLKDLAIQDGLSEEVVNSICNLKKTSDINIEVLFNKLLNNRGQLNI